jgi:uncharacterized protein YndB with AHSA1/START domain
MVKRIGLGLLFTLLVLAAIVAMRSPSYSVARSATLHAPPEQVFAQLSGFASFKDWSPWSKRDPSMTSWTDGPETGVGASYSWSGNDQVGAGTMTIVESTPGKRVGMRLEFKRPFPSVDECAFVLAPEGDGTRVTWSMLGHLSFVGKAMGLFLDWDKLVGSDFEAGLASLSMVVDRASAARADAGKAAR